MKKILLLLIIPFLSFGQISVNKNIKIEKKIKPELIGEFRSMGTTYVECNKYRNNETADYYSFTFRNADSKNIEELHEFGFYDLDNAFENFSAMCLDGFEKLDNYFSINVPDGELTVRYIKSPALGRAMYFVYTENNMSYKTHLITKNKAKKLFGKDQRFPNLLDNFKEQDEQFRREK
ncbi:MAG: hypothetical protein CMD23_01055 [Flavobacteriales bacterium]|nr:hypothetical protein [Flavobacteriales bacterium]|tara:strand:+ start:79 stop:612 length:534 start_codon:yes stop_codon:yes gene_type:complete